VALPNGSPRARFVRRFRWHVRQWRDEFAVWWEYALELDRAQRAALHDMLKAFIRFAQSRDSRLRP
jgi:hypothetical protein